MWNLKQNIAKFHKIVINPYPTNVENMVSF